MEGSLAPACASYPSTALRAVPLPIWRWGGFSALQPFPERHQIVLPNLVHRSARKVGEGEGAVGGAEQAGDLQAEMLEHPADLAILAFGELELDPGVSPRPPLEIGVDRAVAD